MTVKDFVENMAAQSGLDVKDLKVRIMDEVVSTRIDTQIYEKETKTLPEDMRVLLTLADVKISHRALVLCEEKTDEEKQSE